MTTPAASSPPTASPPTASPPDLLTPAQLAAAYLLQLQEAVDSFLAFVRLLRPEYDLQPFQLDLIAALDALGKRQLRNEAGDLIYNLVVNAPPRHGKSEIVTRLFPIWLLVRNPREYIMSTAYNSELAEGFGRDCRTLAQDPRVAQVNPSLALDNSSRAVDEWATTAGGRYFGIGLNGTTTGRPASVLIIDDPIKGPADAESPLLRNRVAQFYTSSLETRLQPAPDGSHAIQVICLTRWHPDDLVGRLEASADWRAGRWALIRFQAISVDASGAEVALWPAQVPLETLARRRDANPREFEALYQQNPYIAGGSLLKSEWWRYYDAPLESYAAVLISLDSAHKTKTINDPSVFMIGGLTPQGDIHILDVVRQRLEYPDLRQMALTLSATWRGRGLRALYVEDRASGQSLVQDLRREAGMAVIAVKADYDKVTRASLVSPLIEGGRVFLPTSATWLDDFVLECEQFPNSAHDDQVDALALLLREMNRIAAPAAMAHTALPPLTHDSPVYGKSLAQIYGARTNPLGRDADWSSFRKITR